MRANSHEQSHVGEPIKGDQAVDKKGTSGFQIMKLESRK